jgi:hypothetical protein
MPYPGRRQLSRPVDLILRRLQLEVAHQHPGQHTAQQQAHGNDAGGSGQ